MRVTTQLTNHENARERYVSELGTRGRSNGFAKKRTALYDEEKLKLIDPQQHTARHIMTRKCLLTVSSFFGGLCIMYLEHFAGCNLSGSMFRGRKLMVIAMRHMSALKKFCGQARRSKDSIIIIGT